MSNVTSADGTGIGYTKIGNGPALVLVDGALCYRASGPNGPLAEILAAKFTVYTYDRRGRGESGDSSPFATTCELEDLAAVIHDAGGHAHVYGISSGAVLALDAAQNGAPIDKLAIYEPPFVVDASRSPVPADISEQAERLVASNRRGAAVKLFMSKGVLVPAPFVTLMPLMPAWKRLKSVAHTLPYDLAFLAGTQSGQPLPSSRWIDVTQPTFVVGGGKSPVWMQHSTIEIARALPAARHHVLLGQTHLVKPKVLAPALFEFFGAIHQ